MCPQGARVHPDINTYRPQDFARLRDLLSKMKKAQDAKRKKREKLYRIQGGVEADVVYDSDDLIVRHIKNKNASVHYGHATKWCISMSREGYFEDYETHNATFFFFERKKALGDEHDKVCLVMFRVDIRGEETTAFNALDRRMDMFALAKNPRSARLRDLPAGPRGECEVPGFGPVPGLPRDRHPRAARGRLRAPGQGGIRLRDRQPAGGDLLQRRRARGDARGDPEARGRPVGGCQEEGARS